MSETKPSPNSWGAGWRLVGYLTITTLASITALGLNMGMVWVLFTAMRELMPEGVQIYGGQFFLYLAPFMLLFLEWWLWDLLIDPFRGSK